jgi:hypothetical protein
MPVCLPLISVTRRIEPVLGEAAADPGQQLVDVGVRVLGVAGDVGRVLQARRAHLHHVFERGMLAHHAVIGGAGEQRQQHQHQARRQQQLRAYP